MNQVKIVSIFGFFSILCLPLQSSFVNSEILNSSGFDRNGLEEGSERIFVSSRSRDIHFYSFSDRIQTEAYSEIYLGSNYSLSNSGLVRNKNVIIITHGFLSGTRSSDEGPCTPIKNAYLAHNFNNIICVDWYKLANPTIPGPLDLLDYFEVVSNVKRVGVKIAKLIKFLIDGGYINGPQMVHLIGHSLGAHASGVAGMRIFRKLDTKVRRITGLDPAGPIYFPFDSIKLHKSDAKFVDCIHTNVNMFGSAESLGHVDFFPNGGIGNEQPGCEDETPLSTIIGDPPCSHLISYTYYARSINGDKLIGCKCTKNRIEHVKTHCSTPPDGTCRKPTLFGEYGPETATGDYYITVPS